jgi:hypothetical protein
MIYIQSFMKISSHVKKLIREIHKHTPWKRTKFVFIFFSKEGKYIDFYLISHRNSFYCIMHVRANPRTLAVLIDLR